MVYDEMHHLGRGEGGREGGRVREVVLTDEAVDTWRRRGGRNEGGREGGREEETEGMAYVPCVEGSR